jgi:hypothetical protein
MSSALARLGIIVWMMPGLPVFAQTDLVVNGSFESGLTGWTTGTVIEPGGGGTCSYNGATAPGVETLTSTPGFPATDGTEIALGSVTSTVGGSARISCTLYQDVAIPAGTAALTLKYDVGAKAGNDGCSNTGLFLGLYSTAAVPSISSSAVGGSTTSLCTATPDSTLVTFTIAKSPASIAGTTVRLAFVNAANVAGHEVIGLDHIQLIATALPTVISVTPSTGVTTGGTSVTITGTLFTGATSVKFGGTAAAFTVVNDSTITAVTPSHGNTAGAVSVSVTTPSGTTVANTAFAYVIPTPTLSEWGMIGLTGLLLLFGWFKLRKPGDLAGAA